MAWVKFETNWIIARKARGAAAVSISLTLLPCAKIEYKNTVLSVLFLNLPGLAVRWENTVATCRSNRWNRFYESKIKPKSMVIEGGVSQKAPLSIRKLLTNSWQLKNCRFLSLIENLNLMITLSRIFHCLYV